MTVYRFPEQLGGGEYEIPTPSGCGDRAVFDVPGVGEVTVPLSALVEVAPPLPPEPDLHAVVLDGMGHAWQRTSIGWLPGGGGPREWAEVCEHGAPTLLVLDPFAEKVTLPWRLGDLEVAVAPASEFPVHVGIADAWVRLTPDDARAFVAAIWAAAADAAEAGAS